MFEPKEKFCLSISKLERENDIHGFYEQSYGRP